MNKKNVLIKLQSMFFIVIFILSGCVHKKNIDKQKIIISPKVSSRASTPKNPPLTIWVHGTLMFRKPLYYKVFDEQSGIVHINTLKTDHHFSLLAQTLVNQDSDRFSLQEFYIFTWSGKLNKKERKKAAQKLYTEIIQRKEEYEKKYGCAPQIQIITHSHGGNVALYMAKIKNKEECFRIASLILLACPVQERTMYLTKNPLFEKVYSLYSSLDIIQILAPQIKRKNPINKYKLPYRIPPFSSRLFPHSENLIQAKIKVNNYPISHTTFSTQNFIVLLPSILEKLDSWHQETIIHTKSHKHKLLCVYKNNFIDK